MQTGVETSEFLRRAKACGVTDYKRAATVDLIAADPTGGDEMPGTDGARKLRFARPGQRQARWISDHHVLQRQGPTGFLIVDVREEREKRLEPRRKERTEQAVKATRTDLPKESTQMKTTKATPKTKATTKAGQSILQSAREALAYASGATQAGYAVHVPAKIDVKAIREKVQMSQEEFARSFGFSKRSLEQWEQGRRTPTGASRAFFAVIAREPEAGSPGTYAALEERRAVDLCRSV